MSLWPAGLGLEDRQVPPDACGAQVRRTNGTHMLELSPFKGCKSPISCLDNSTSSRSWRAGASVESQTPWLPSLES